MTVITSQSIQDQTHQTCARCVLDSSVSDIRFNQQGVCHYCDIHDALEEVYPLGKTGEERWQSLVADIKRAGRGRDYDIVVGVSGGRDSTYALYQCVQMGLRPLAVHFDNGWNSDIAVTNIQNATNALDVDLQTFVIDWEEFRDLQVAFLKASVSDAEIPTDVAIHGLLHRTAAQEGIKHLVFAHSFRTEGVAPLGWTYMDGRYIKSVHKQFGTRPLKTFPNMTMTDVLYYRFVKRIQAIPLLAFIPYEKTSIDQLLTDKLGWTYYGGHHHESYYTHFFQSYYLPKKFGIDKRKIEYSALIRSGQMTRTAAQKEIAEQDYPYDPQLVTYTLRKLGLSESEFAAIMAAPNRSFHDYKTYYPMIRACKGPIRLLDQWLPFPRQLILKFLG